MWKKPLDFSSCDIFLSLLTTECFVTVVTPCLFSAVLSLPLRKMLSQVIVPRGPSHMFSSVLQGNLAGWE